MNASPAEGSAGEAEAGRRDHHRDHRSRHPDLGGEELPYFSDSQDPKRAVFRWPSPAEQYKAEQHTQSEFPSIREFIPRTAFPHPRSIYLELHELAFPLPFKFGVLLSFDAAREQLLFVDERTPICAPLIL